MNRYLLAIALGLINEANGDYTAEVKAKFVERYLQMFLEQSVEHAYKKLIEVRYHESPGPFPIPPLMLSQEKESGQLVTEAVESFRPPWPGRAKNAANPGGVQEGQEYDLSPLPVDTPKN